MRRAVGFTLVELVTVIIVLGILAAVALPRIDLGWARSAEFRDQVVSALRFAQKTAVSHRRLVCVTFAGNSMTLAIADANPAAACNLALPAANGAAAITSAFATLAATPPNFFIQPDGRVTATGNANAAAANQTIAFTDAPNVIVDGVTGYVR